MTGFFPSRLAEQAGLNTSIQYVKGVGPYLAGLLAKKGVFTVEDALLFLPRKYEDRREIRRISAIKAGRKEMLVARVAHVATTPRRRSGRQIFDVTLDDGSGILQAKWFKFNRKYLEGAFKPGVRVVVSGEIKSYGFSLEMHHPDFEVLDDEAEGGKSLHFGRIVPFYSETEGLYQKTLRRILSSTVEKYAAAVPETLPEDIRRKLGLPGLSEALRTVHFPPDDADFEKLLERRSAAHRRLVFEELYFLEVGLALRRQGIALQTGIGYQVPDSTMEELTGQIDFELTGAQKRVLDEIVADMQRPHPMNRLIQGDVGSGKTVVAVLAAAAAVDEGYQAAVMAPTEILAEQHYRNISPLLEKMGIGVELLTSSTHKRSREKILRSLSDGSLPFIVGTQSLIQEGIDFKRLGFVVIDEQHRFGVVQRALLRKKGISPDVLVMTATPIPRTLAMTLYGDLDVSVIDQMPPGRCKVQTLLFTDSDREKLYRFLRDEMNKGRQVYVVYPLVEESARRDLKDATQMSQSLAEEFKEFKVGLLHGRMRGRDKESIMHGFQEGKLNLLVSTTVIEVGIDVPNAAVMVIEHAERFGLSQLHQLRGRVGRSDLPSTCILVAGKTDSEDAQRRIQVMVETTDGFRIAEEDLSIRGPGEFLGTRQSGLPPFRIANIARDMAVLAESRKAAFDIVASDPGLTGEGSRLIREVVMTRWKGKLELASVG